MTQAANCCRSRPIKSRSSVNEEFRKIVNKIPTTHQISGKSYLLHLINLVREVSNFERQYPLGEPISSLSSGSRD